VPLQKNPLVDYELGNSLNAAAEPENLYLSKPEIEKLIREKKKINGKIC
jgi:excinuclease ABC subunit B